MAKTRVDLRLDDVLLGRIDSYAERRLSTRTAIVTAACLAFLEDAQGGVPELGEMPVPNPPASPRVPDFGSQVAPASDPRWERQQKLNEAKYGRKR